VESAGVVTASDEVPAAEPSVPPGPSEGQGPTGLPVPPVLLGEPKLTSTPGALPTAEASVADSLLDGGEVDGLVVRAASIRGDEHRYYGETRQDAFAIASMLTPAATPNSPALLVAVADGIGSEELSQVGSQTVCSLLARHMRSYAGAILNPGSADPSLRDKRCLEVVEALHEELNREAKRRNVAPRALSTTLSVALIGTADGLSRRAIVFAVGDSPIFTLRNGQFSKVLPVEADGGLAGNPTDALPTSIGPVRATELSLQSGDMLLVCTDGLGNPMKGNPSVTGHLAWSWADPPSLPDFYWQFSFRAVTFGDDRTAVCVWTP
jgi:serine/threonine protein phosphatase PrpC